MVVTAPLKVLSIAHSAVNRASGRVRYETLENIRTDIALTLVAPDRWQEYGKPMLLDPHEGGMDFRVEHIRLPHVPRAGWYLHHYPGLRKLLNTLRPDVIHLWEEPWSLVGLHAIALRDRLLPASAVLLETDQNIMRRLPFPFEQIRRYTLARTDLLIHRQPESLDVSRACGFTGPGAIVEYGVADSIFFPHDRVGARAALDVDGLVLGYVGRIVRDKGLFEVLDAMAACPVPVTLLLLGTGPDAGALLARASELGLAGRVRLLEPRPPASVARVMNALDLLILMSRTTPTWKEQFGRVIMEAHACGVPVIGSDSGAIPGVVADGGWIVPEGDAAGLAALIERLAGAPEEVAQAGAAGRRQAAGRFSVTTVANALGDAFLAASAARRAAGRHG